MTWAIFGVLSFALAITLFWVFQLTVTVSKTSSNALASLISFDQRASQERMAHRDQIQGLVDRIMSGDWESVRLHEGVKETEEGGFFSPEEQDEDEPVHIESLRGSWGSVSTAQARADALDEVEAFASADDLDGADAERMAHR